MSLVGDSIGYFLGASYGGSVLTLADMFLDAWVGALIEVSPGSLIGILNCLMFGTWVETLVGESLVPSLLIPLFMDLVNPLGSLLVSPNNGYLIGY